MENTLIDDSYEHREGGVTINHLTFPGPVARHHLNHRLVCKANNTAKAPAQSKAVVLDINREYYAIAKCS
ncbi:hypothetical protein FOCC_FOCC017127, partial [Frankliniella occidentalis]